MKNLLLCCGIILYCTVAFAQKTVLSYQPEIDQKADKKAGYESFVFTDDATGKTAVILKKGQSIEYLLLNKDLTIESKVVPANGVSGTIFKGERYDHYYGGVMNKKGASFFFLVKDKDVDKGEWRLRMESVDFTKKTVSSIVIPMQDGWIKTFTVQQNFYIVGTNVKSKEIVLYKVDENGNSTRKAWPEDLKGYSKLDLYDYFYYSRVFNPNKDTELPEVTDLTKVYPYTDKLVMVVTNEKEPPHIWTIDLKNYTLTKKKFELTDLYGYEEGKKGKAQNNSTLYNNNLFVFSTSKEKVEIGIYDFTTGKLVKRHEITEADFANFAETPSEVMTLNSRSKVNPITSYKELVKELSKGTTGIAIANSENGNLLLTCGIYDKEERQINHWIPDANTHGATFHRIGFASGPRVSTLTRIVNFKLSLNPADFSIVKSKSVISSFDKINDNLKAVSANIQAGNFFETGNKVYYSYYNPEKTSFTILDVTAGK